MTGMEITITLHQDVVDRLPLRRTTPETPEEYQEAQRGVTFPVSIEDFVNDAIRRHPTLSECAERNRMMMIRAGASLGYSGYRELWEEECGG